MEERVGSTRLPFGFSHGSQNSSLDAINAGLPRGYPGIWVYQRFFGISGVYPAFRRHSLSAKATEVYP